MNTDHNKYRIQVEEAVAWLRNQTDLRPRVGVLTGTGLGETIKEVQVKAAFDYRQIPYFPLSTVQSHPGRLLVGKVGGVSVVAMQGRFHLYEGYTPLEVTFPVRVMQSLGIEYLILTNAAGGLNPGYNPGDIMLITDHINLTGANPLVGSNEDRWGVRFPDMGFAYDQVLARRTESVAAKLGISLRTGVYAGLTGPSLETPAEIRFLQLIGADAVGFSTVQEVIAAVHGNIKVLGLSTITNAHTPAAPVPANVEAIIAVAQKTAPALGKLICTVITELLND
ncbi:MAG: purine-nucleoside phosphorylase [Thermodesulfobacteriota bacterium]|nr:purine-nucleoside phosphorylase [Thermodesulfobacteriota bacterium]